MPADDVVLQTAVHVTLHDADEVAVPAHPLQEDALFDPIVVISIPAEAAVQLPLHVVAVVPATVVQFDEHPLQLVCDDEPPEHPLEHPAPHPLHDAEMGLAAADDVQPPPQEDAPIISMDSESSGFELVVEP